MKYFSIIHFRSRDTTVCLPVCLFIYLSVRCRREEKRTEDLLITRNEILVIIKVFRLQRKILLLFLGFFFPIIIIRAFRLRRKDLLLLCFFIIFFF